VRRDLTAPIAFLVVVLTGGLNSTAVKFSLVELAPFWSGALRLFLAAAFFVGWMLIRRLELPRGRALTESLLYGLLNFAAFLGLMYWGLQTTPAGFAMVILAVVPLLTMTFAAAHRLEPLRLRGIAGSLIALAGIALIASERVGNHSATLEGLVAVGLAAAAMAETNVVVKLFPRPHPVVNNAIGQTVGAVVLFALALLAGEPLTLPTMPQTWAALAYVVVPGTIILFIAFLVVIERWSATATSYALLLMPLVAVVGAGILLNEPITPLFVLGAVVVIVGVYIGAFAVSSVWRLPGLPTRLQPQAAGASGDGVPEQQVPPCP
jgi:drug/metabolite transporter (DMT)-like permease